MTGEITLRGRVLPVGGVKEKLLAAHRAGLTHFFMPSKNSKDLEDIPRRVLRELKLEVVDHVDTVLEGVLLPPLPAPEPDPDSEAAGGAEDTQPEV
jgi:ATP-dependent Lon protease